MERERTRDHHDWADEAESLGCQIRDRIREMVNEVNKRRLIMSRANGKVLFEVPLMISLIVVGVAAIFGPRLVAFGAIAALVAGLKVEVRRRPNTTLDDMDDFDY